MNYVKIKCRLNENACNSKRKWNQNKFWQECKELEDWGYCQKGYMRNPSTCDCECNKTWTSVGNQDTEIVPAKKI